VLLPSAQSNPLDGCVALAQNWIILGMREGNPATPVFSGTRGNDPICITPFELDSC
jgi:hypothetical protein